MYDNIIRLIAKEYPYQSHVIIELIKRFHFAVDYLGYSDQIKLETFNFVINQVNIADGVFMVEYIAAMEKQKRGDRTSAQFIDYVKKGGFSK